MLSYLSPPVPPDPVLTGPPETIMEGEPFELTCTSPDTSKPIVWQLMGSTDPLPNPPASEQDGMFGTSTLRVRSALVSDSGEYLCQVGDTESSFTVTVVMVPGKEGGAGERREGRGRGGRGKGEGGEGARGRVREGAKGSREGRGRGRKVKRGHKDFCVW